MGIRHYSGGNQALFKWELGSFQVGIRLYSGGNQALFSQEISFIQVGIRLYSGGNQGLFRWKLGSIQLGIRLYSAGNQALFSWELRQALFSWELGSIQLGIRLYSGGNQALFSWELGSCQLDWELGSIQLGIRLYSAGNQALIGDLLISPYCYVLMTHNQALSDVYFMCYLMCPGRWENHKSSNLGHSRPGEIPGHNLRVSTTFLSAFLLLKRALDPNSFFVDPDPAVFYADRDPGRIINADPDPRPWWYRIYLLPFKSILSKNYTG